MILAAALVMALMLPQTARAQHGGGGWHGGGGGGGGWHGGNSGGGGNGWHGSSGGGGSGWHGGGGGSWHQGWYGSRYGWWWVVPGFGWYAYDEPIYPYPDPDAYTQAVSAPPYWYYCSNPARFLPLCDAVLRTVAAGSGATAGPRLSTAAGLRAAVGRSRQ